MAVAEQTVAALAKQLKITVSRLLSLLKEAGIAVENEEDTLTPAQKVALTKHMAANPRMHRNTRSRRRIHRTR